MLNRFTDFIKECLPRYNETRDSITNFHELKSRATEARESLAKKTNSEPTVEPISERAIIGSGVSRPK